ncbi:MAG: S1/P1 nuclease [Planctomycetota bacterium]|nr:S1/P1 nuclease [Planctomycetota bacterium]
MPQPFPTARRTATNRRMCVVLAVTILGQHGWIPNANGFGQTGHRAVGHIAQRHLTQQALAAVKAILGNETLAEVSTYADEIRSNPDFDYTKTWHYVNIPNGKNYDTAPLNSDGDAIEAIERFTKTLRSKNATDKERVFALKWLGHLVGDIHQPLHVGRAEDFGGNKITCKWFGKSTNLHTVWDSKLIEATELSDTEFAKVCDKASAAEKQKWQNSTVRDWASESLKHRAQAYKEPLPTTAGSYRYSHDNLPLVKKRVNQAGIRLAGLLNDIYGK